ncbi:AEC family transporter [Pseudoduganella ginsengisoli]|uniref:AEC family transporter n=1 Tax=Pseudoduganella ginsengisoli TaxID=1462440 RepID=A0A6L6Q575_9BURK|nr:AEC family transporter [Pseudoduganella ginsengisoli]MTW05053.1 AEC family transporter [Pseudoduganella ginsengisoli]
MLAIFAVTFPFFALVLCGYLAVRRGMLPLVAIPGMNTFVLFFALPCMLYRFGANTPIAQLLDPGVFTVYLLCALLMVGITMAATLSHRIDWNDAAFGALVAAFPNNGFMGVPLLLALIGPRSSGPVILTIVIDMVITASLCIALSRVGSGSGRAAVANALKGVVSNPMPWAIALGALTSVSGLALPAPVAKTIGLLADAASPVALFTIGAVLARSQMSTADATPLREYVPVALKKLALHPLLMWCIGHGALRLGLPLDPAALDVIILVACLPSASNVAMLAERFGANTGRIARIILVSTALSFLTFSGAVAVLR